MIKIAPSILASDFAVLKETINRLNEANVDYIHFDIMDGSFVPNITFGPKFVSDLRGLTKIKFSVHLMVEEPARYCDDFIKAGADLVSFHIEAEKYPLRLLKKIKQANRIKCGLAFNPVTAINYDIISEFDFVLIMSVEPGFFGQDFIESSISKIQELKSVIKQRNWDVEIEVDGGINIKNVKKVISSGANTIVMGSSFFKNKDYKEFVKKIKA